MNWKLPAAMSLTMIDLPFELIEPEVGITIVAVALSYVFWATSQ